MVDITRDMGYNNTQSDETNEVVIDLTDVAPLNDTGCKHDTLVADPEDTLGDAVYHGCSNPKCGLGFYIRPMQ